MLGTGISISLVITIKLLVNYFYLTTRGAFVWEDASMGVHVPLPAHFEAELLVTVLALVLLRLSMRLQMAANADLE